MGRLPRLLLAIAERTGVAGHQSLTRDHLAYCNLTTGRQQRAYDIVTNTMPAQFLAWNTETQLSPTHCARFPNSALAAGRGCTIRLPPSAKARRRERTPRPLGLSFRSTGRCPAKSSQLVPVPPLTPRATPLSVLSPFIWIYLSTFPVRTLAGVFRCNAGRPVPTATTVATEGFASGVDVVCSTTSPRYSPHTTSLTTTFRLLLNDSKWTPIGSRSRWRHRGDVRDALNGTFLTVLGTGYGPPALSRREFALLGRRSEPSPPYQTSAPPDANWSSTTGTFSQ